MSDVMSAIYCGGPLYSGGTPVFDDLKESGFSTVIEWTMRVSPTGDFVLDETILSNGTYTGAPDWPAQLAGLKQGITSIDRLLFSIGGWEVGAFTNIQALIKQQGTGSSSILYRNFQALKQAIPAIDGIDFDDETVYDPDTTVPFAQMLNALGYQVTFCPYDNMDFWVECLVQLNGPTPGLVTGFNLQCYAGGAGNNPQDWINAIAEAMPAGFPAAELVYPGLWCRNEDPGGGPGTCPSGVSSQFANWQSTGIQGGFIWLYDDVQKYEDSGLCGPNVPMTTKSYAGAIRQGLQP